MASNCLPKMKKKKLEILMQAVRIFNDIGKGFGKKKAQ